MRSVAILVFVSSLWAQHRIEARLEEPTPKTSLQVEAYLMPTFLRWLYSGTWGGREVPGLDFLTRPEGSYWIDHAKRACYAIQSQVPKVYPTSTPTPEKVETYLGFAAQSYRLSLSDGSEVRLLWTRAVSFDWRAWQPHLRDEVLSALLEAGFLEGLPLRWERRSAKGEILSRWTVEKVSPHSDQLAGVLPYEVQPIEKAMERQP